jgi:hypothetical protein
MIRSPAFLQHTAFLTEQQADRVVQAMSECRGYHEQWSEDCMSARSLVSGFKGGISYV